MQENGYFFFIICWNYSPFFQIGGISTFARNARVVRTFLTTKRCVQKNIKYVVEHKKSE